MTTYIECQPCQEFKDKDYPDSLYNYHQCPKCLTGTVRFCYNCFYDHHEHGYESCLPDPGCLRKHPACLAKVERSESQHAGTPMGEFI